MKQIKIAISGKANSGKNTAGSIIEQKAINKLGSNFRGYQHINFADPIKEMILIMFPNIDSECLYGPSKMREAIIKEAFDKNNDPLTCRQLLIDIGTSGRAYNKNIWINAFDSEFKKSKELNLIICNDVRFPNEFEYLKNNGFFIIKLYRNSSLHLNDLSEKSIDLIDDTKFDSIIHNNSTISFLKDEVDKIVELLI